MTICTFRPIFKTVSPLLYMGLYFIRLLPLSGVLVMVFALVLLDGSHPLQHVMPAALAAASASTLHGYLPRKKREMSFMPFVGWYVGWCPIANVHKPHGCCFHRDGGGDDSRRYYRSCLCCFAPPTNYGPPPVRTTDAGSKCRRVGVGCCVAVDLHATSTRPHSGGFVGNDGVCV